MTLRRLWPGGMAARLALILLLGLLAVQAAGAFLYLFGGRAEEAIEARAAALAEQADGIARLVEATPPGARPDLLRVLSGHRLRVELADAKPDLGRGDRWLGAGLDEAVAPYLDGRPFEVRLLEGRREVRRGADGERGEHGLLPSRRRIALAVGQPDGSWLVLTAPSGVGPPRRPLRATFWLAATALVVLLAGGWAAHRVARPLERFAEAADRLGVDVRAPPLPEETGSRELRRATRAFNRMQERLRRVVDDRTMMLAAISHDLRTALTRLKLRTEFIDDPEQRRKALADLDEMQAMLDSTLAFARDDAATEARTGLDLAALLQSLCDDLADAGRPVAYEGPPRLTYIGRPVALRRAFANLIDNAVTYGHEATVTLAEREGRVVEVAVADRGPGIPEDMRERVFAPFFRLEGSRSRETGGTGLGLAVARDIVRRHGGDIVLADRQGGGLLARVTLPRAAA
ncbi:MAG TPA: ATP-binding protein [Geminicoccaceae bacterium]|nr:ATP-binding protein [Geminicoccaceae bacterium]